LVRRTSTFQLSEETRIEIVEFVRSSNTYPLLYFFPIGCLATLLGWSATTVFVVNLFAVIPLATLLSLATEQLSEYTGQTVGALLNATFGNAVELIVRCILEFWWGSRIANHAYTDEHGRSVQRRHPRCPSKHDRSCPL
jgi:hypothetical protein